MILHLRNGTRIVRGPDWCRTRLPCGAEVFACPEARTPAIAENMGCSVAELTRDHDALHSIALGEWLGQPFSYSLMKAAGQPVDPKIAELEEHAVMAIQRLWVALRKKRP